MDPDLVRLARDLRYQTLSDLLGHPVTIRGLDTLQADLVQAFAPTISAAMVLRRLEPRYRLGALVKYGLLDLAFTLPEPITIVNDIEGLPLLEQLRIVRPPDPADPPIWLVDVVELGQQWDVDPIGIDCLEDDLAAPDPHLKLFLETPLAPDPLEAARSAADPWNPAQAHMFTEFVLPTGYFPRTFIVVDACLTNASSVWLGKHFYV